MHNADTISELWEGGRDVGTSGQGVVLGVDIYKKYIYVCMCVLCCGLLETCISVSPPIHSSQQQVGSLVLISCFVLDELVPMKFVSCSVIANLTEQYISARAAKPL